MKSKKGPDWAALTSPPRARNEVQMTSNRCPTRRSWNYCSEDDLADFEALGVSCIKINQDVRRCLVLPLLSFAKNPALDPQYSTCCVVGQSSLVATTPVDEGAHMRLSTLWRP